MPKKMGVNSKAEVARARKSATESDRKDRESREKEEQYWREAEGAKSRAAKKREDEAEKRAEVAARKAEAKRLAELEEKELEKSMKKPDKKANRVSVPVPKVTEAELQRRREEEQAELAKKAEEAKKRHARTAAEEEYERMVLVTNTNRDESVIEARSVEEALEKMVVADNLPVDRHPERRLKASFKAFEEAELPRLKEEKPGLTHNQYKDMIWKLWKKSPDNPLNQLMMMGKRRIEHRLLSLLRTRTVKKRRTIIVGLKSDNSSREMLLQSLNVIVKPGDNVVAVHVQEPNDQAFDLNTFHIHEDLCKSRQVDFLVKVCNGDSYISELSNEVRSNSATILALRCSLSGPKDSVVNKFLKALPPTCTLMIMDNGGRVIFQRQGTSQQGSTSVTLQKSLSVVPSSSISSSVVQDHDTGLYTVKKAVQVPDFLAQKLFQRLALIGADGSSRCFTPQELSHVTNNYSPELLIGQGGNSNVYRANLEDGQVVAVKVLKATHWSEEDVLREVQLLSSMKHHNIVGIIGYCYSKEVQAVVYYLLNGSLKRYLRQLKWSERMDVAIGVAKALEYLHHCCDPPIVHRDVKSSNILLSENCQPQLSDFGAAMVHHHRSQQVSANVKPINVVGTFGYLAPEYMMYGKVDEKIDVYSYGVVLLELITGKEAIHTNQSNHESLVLWARSLLSCGGLCERLIDPYLNGEYKKEEMETMMCAARLCLLHSSSRRPTMKMILKLFEEPECWLKMQRQKDELLNGNDSKGSETGLEYCIAV
ncbi:hypothetical protein EZV62_011950 [Acer yangbiense]|uniref:Protein kinase domain-containing protein n=1 Tax=Acer yangbiense TaxID=1000413 RepID=A0A5C7I9B1_9ROSI|nr:hypothetical protein EZV62_011950 [Acer yangbiense]